MTIAGNVPNSDNNTNSANNQSSLNTTINRHNNSELMVLSIIIISCGVFGNILAIIMLNKKNNCVVKQTKLDFFLRRLLANNFIALFGMLVQNCLERYLLTKINNLMILRCLCGFRVVWRYFGLNSGCCVLLMAIDRWLSLAKPFYYQKRVTMEHLKLTLYLLWFITALITFAPLLGFGVYFNDTENICIRYRDAKETIDVFYAYAFLTFGVSVCFGIIFCNICVTRVLCIASNFDGRSERLMDSNENNKLSGMERKFIKLIIVLSISFVICWMPQMISIVLAQFKHNLNGDITKIFFMVSDLLMAVHFGLDPYIYVLLRPKHFTYLTNVLKQSVSKSQILSIT